MSNGYTLELSVTLLSFLPDEVVKTLETEREMTRTWLEYVKDLGYFYKFNYFLSRRQNSFVHKRVEGVGGKCYYFFILSIFGCTFYTHSPIVVCKTL